MKDFYEVLGVSRTASQDEIKHAYRKKARKLHPDYAGPESEDAFKELTVAYEVLSDPEKRSAYDAGGPEALRGGGMPMGDFGFADLFEAMFGMGGMSGFGGGGRGPTPRGRRGQDSMVAVEVNLEEITFGVTKDISINTAVTCTVCDGTCCEPGTSPVTCSVCGGTGSVTRVQQSLLGAIRTAQVCQACGGHGQTIPSPCLECGGDGRIHTTRNLSVDIPAGVEGGTRIRLRDEGEVGPGGGPSGDLYIEVRELPHEIFSRQGFDLHTAFSVPMTAAALGTVLDLHTFDGDREVTLKPGTQSGADIVMKGLGVGRLGGRGRGDLHVHIDVVTPTDMGPEEVELIERLADLRGEERVEPVGASTGAFGWLKKKFAG